jgi:hypothetical protein
MYKDIAVIIAIIISSYIFTLKQGNKNGLFNPQLMYILLTLSMVVLFKMVHYNKLTTNEEGFVVGEMHKFLKGQSDNNVGDRLTTISEPERKKYVENIADLSSQIAVLNQRLTENSGDPSNKLNSNLGTNDTMNLETIQKMQNFQIDYLQKQIERSKQLLQQQEIEENIKKYKPIKVYSSCAISSADGSFNEDKLTATKSNNTSMTNDQIQSMASMLNTIGQTGAGNTETNTQNSENVLGGLVAGLLNGQQTTIQLS